MLVSLFRMKRHIIHRHHLKRKRMMPLREVCIKKDSFIIIYLKESIFKEDWKASEHKYCEQCRRGLENKCFDRSETV